MVSLPCSGSEPVEPERCVYGVRHHDAPSDAPLEMIERRFLRHRVLHTKAYINVFDDKTHGSHAAQVTAVALLYEEVASCRLPNIIGCTFLIQQGVPS